MRSNWKPWDSRQGRDIRNPRPPFGEQKMNWLAYLYPFQTANFAEMAIFHVIKECHHNVFVFLCWYWQNMGWKDFIEQKNVKSPKHDFDHFLCAASPLKQAAITYCGLGATHQHVILSNTICWQQITWNGGEFLQVPNCRAEKCVCIVSKMWASTATNWLQTIHAAALWTAVAVVSPLPYNRNVRWGQHG